MGTPYSILYDGVLSKFKDYELAQLTKDDIYSIISEYLRPAIVSFHICSQDLSDRDVVDLINGGFNIDLSDSEITILVNYMTIDYIDSNFLKVPTLMKANLSSVDYNAFSPANHIDKLTKMHENCLKENETLVVRYSISKLKKK